MEMLGASIGQVLLAKGLGLERVRSIGIGSASRTSVLSTHASAEPVFPF